MLNFELLTKEDIERIRENESLKDTLDAKVTPFGNFDSNESPTMDILNQSFPYWLSDIEETFKHGQICTKCYPYFYYGLKKVRVGVVAKGSQTFQKELSDSEKNGIRLKIPYSQIVDEIIEEKEEDGKKIVVAFQFPQNSVPEDIAHDMNLLHNNNLLKNKKTSFYNRGIYIFNDRRFIKSYSQWFELTPLEWYHDEQSDMVYSKSVLYTMPIGENYNGDITISPINDFIINFKAICMMDAYEKNLEFLPFRIESHREELEKLHFLEKKEHATDEMKQLASFLLGDNSTEDIRKELDIDRLRNLCENWVEVHDYENGYPTRLDKSTKNNVYVKKSSHQL